MPDVVLSRGRVIIEATDFWDDGRRRVLKRATYSCMMFTCQKDSAGADLTAMSAGRRDQQPRNEYPWAANHLVRASSASKTPRGTGR